MANRKYDKKPSGLWLLIGVTAVCIGVYIVQRRFFAYDPGELWRIAYGVMAAALLLGAMLYGVRRRTMRLGIGKAKTWLDFHLYGGVLFALFVLMHSGFQMPAGLLNWWLWLLSLWVTISGVLGLLLQKWLPKMLASGLSVEVLFARIPELIGEIETKAAHLAQMCDEPMAAFYRDRIAPALAGPRFNPVYFYDLSGGSQKLTNAFEHLKKTAADDQQHTVAQIERMYKTKLEIDAHYTIQLALRTWLFLHVPPAMLLLALVGVHVFSVWYF